MKLLESILRWIAVLFFAMTGVLALVWVGVIAVSAIKPNPEEPAATTAAATTEAPLETAATTSSGSPEEASDSVASAPAPAIVTVSADAGAKVFKKCKSCHDAAEDGKDKTGPNLWDVIDRPAAASEGFKYSDAMLARAGEPWTVDQLKVFLADPKGTVPGTAMSFGGLKKEADILNLIAFLGQQSANPRDVVALGLASAEAAAAAAAAEAAPAAEAAETEVAEAETGSDEIEYDDVPWPEGVTYVNPPEPTEAEREAIAARVAALKEEIKGIDYERARFHPLHFPPAIEKASNEECLVCHQEVLSYKPREMSPAGVPVDATLAWYQTLDTYEGPQSTFHYRHLESDFARTVMNLECTFCHKGNDPREESPDIIPDRMPFTAAAIPEFTLRKMVNPSETCLRCHGAMPDPENIMGLAGPWHEIREDMEWPEAPNGCMSCHADSFRTARHNVSYLNALNIEEYARAGSSDVCYGCHGGRAWYRISYPYPRHVWPTMEDMVGTEVPEWAADRPTESEPQYALPTLEE